MWQLRRLEIVGWVFLAYGIAANQSTILVWALTTVFGSPVDAPEWMLQNIVLISPAFPLFLGLAALLRLRLGGIAIGPLVGFSRKTIGSDLRVGMLVGALSILITIVSLRVASSALPVPRLGDFPTHFHIYFATVGALIPGICEEIYFRGLIFRIGDPLPKFVLLPVSALAFALWHVGTPIYLIHTFVLGMIWGAVFLSTGRLAPSIFAHVFANMGFGLLLLSGLEISTR